MDGSYSTRTSKTGTEYTSPAGAGASLARGFTRSPSDLSVRPADEKMGGSGCIIDYFIWLTDALEEVGQALKITGSVFPKAFLFAFPSALLAVGLHYFFRYTQTDWSSPVENSESIYSGFTYILGVMLVFRTNQAYSRYWEGATLLLQTRGEWLNAVSSLFAFCSAEESMRDAVLRFQHQLVRLMSMLYCAALQTVALVEDDSMLIIDNQGLDPESMRYLFASGERCDVLLQWIRRLVVQSMSKGVIPVPPPILTRVFQELSRGIVNAKDVQKIADFSFPFPYSQLIVTMLVIQTFITPLRASTQGNDPISAFISTFFVNLGYWSVNYIACELEQPFGEDDNDLPIPQMMEEMNDRLIALMQKESQTPPHFEFYLGMEECRVTNAKEMGYTQPKAASTDGGAMGTSRTSLRHSRSQQSQGALPMMLMPSDGSNFDHSGTAGGASRKTRGRRPSACSSRSARSQKIDAFFGASSESLGDSAVLQAIRGSERSADSFAPYGKSDQSAGEEVSSPANPETEDISYEQMSEHSPRSPRSPRSPITPKRGERRLSASQQPGSSRQMSRTVTPERGTMGLPEVGHVPSRDQYGSGSRRPNALMRSSSAASWLSDSEVGPIIGVGPIGGQPVWDPFAGPPITGTPKEVPVKKGRNAMHRRDPHAYASGSVASVALGSQEVSPPLPDGHPDSQGIASSAPSEMARAKAKASRQSIVIEM